MHAGLIVLIIAVFGCIIGLHLHGLAMRRKELAAYASANRLRFSPGKDGSFDDRFPEFRCLGRGRSRFARNIISGRIDGLEIQAFDYQYTTGGGKNRKTHRFSALIAGSPVSLKPLLIRRENFFDKIGEFFGVDDIDFESAEFSKKFFVKSPDRRWAFDVIHPQMMEYLLEAPRFSIQFDTADIIVWRNSRFKVEDFDRARGLVRGMLDRLPDYLFRK